MALGLMCVHAHPDDETIGTGGVLRKAADEGIRTAVVTCTGGELGEIVGEGMDEAEVRPRLGAVRREELAAALALLGAGEPRLLGYRDSGMVGTPGNADPRSFWQAGLDEAIGRAVAQIREFRPEVMVVYDPFGGYGHPDHVMAHRVGLLAAEAASVTALYPSAGPAWRVAKVYQQTIPKSFIAQANEAFLAQGIPSPFGEDVAVEDIPMGTPDELITTTVDVREQLPVKMAALKAHYSQVAPSSFFFSMPGEMVQTAFGTESFLRQRSDVTVPPGPEDDLFTGLR